MREAPLRNHRSDSESCSKGARVCGSIIQVAERATRVKWSKFPLRARSSIFRSAPRGTSLVDHNRYREVNRSGPRSTLAQERLTAPWS